MRLRRTRLASLVGNAIGVAIGCLLGMFPLLFMSDPDAVEAVKRKEKVNIYFTSFIVDSRGAHGMNG